jgi:hypothetical protein
MKLPISPDLYLLSTTVIYALVGLSNLFVYTFTDVVFIQIVWILVLSLPIILPISKIVRGAPLWKR